MKETRGSGGSGTEGQGKGTEVTWTKAGKVEKAEEIRSIHNNIKETSYWMENRNIQDR